MAGTNFREGVSSAVRQGICDFAADVENFGDWFYARTRPLWLPRPEAVNDVTLIGGGLAGLLCGELPTTPLPPPEVTPFTGGQCDVLYRVIADLSFTSNGDDVNFPNRNVGDYLGPIGGVVLDTGGAGQSLYVYVIQGDGTQKGWINSNNNNTGYSNQSLTNVRVVRKDNQPDNCGDPPAVPRPPFQIGPNIFDIDITYDPGTGVVDIPGNLTLGFPIILVNGELSIPFDLSGANFEINGEFNLNADEINFNFDGGGSGNESCCLPPDVDVDPPTTPEDPPEDDPEERDIMIGVIVTSTIVSQDITASRIGQEDGPNFYHPRLGNVHFEILVSGRKVWSEDLPVRNRQQFIQCPADFGAVNVVGDPAQGVNWTLTPVYRRILATEYPN